MKKPLSAVTMLLGCLVLLATTSLAFASNDKDICAKKNTEEDCEKEVKTISVTPALKVTPRCKWISSDDGSGICHPA